MKNLILTILMMMPLLAFATTGHDQGSGGDGLWLDGKLYSLDLVEAGVEQNPYFDSSVKIDSTIAKRIANKLNNKDFPVALLTAKLSEVASLDRLFGLILLKAIEAYQWRLVNSALVDINDDYSALKFVQEDLVQLASRSMTSIMIDRSLWQKLDDKNRVALILHEVIYALNPPKDGVHGQEQSSPDARELNGYLFTEDLSKYGATGLKKVAQREYSDFIIGDRSWCDLRMVGEVSGGSLYLCPMFYFHIADVPGSLPWPNALPTDAQTDTYVKGLCTHAVSSKNEVYFISGYNYIQNISLSSFVGDGGVEKGYLKLSGGAQRANGFTHGGNIYTDQDDCERNAGQDVKSFVQDLKVNFR